MLMKRLSKAILQHSFHKTPLLLGGLCLSGSLLAAPAPVDSSKAVFVGHSLINYEMPEMVKQLAQSGEGLSIEKAVQVINGSPLNNNWDKCTEAAFVGQWPPQAFACDEINAGSSSGAYDTLVVTEANNPIRGKHIFNATQEYLEKFADLLHSKNPNGRTFLFTSWEGIYYHEGEWTDEIAGELAEYEQIVAEARRISIDKGINASIDIIPASLALKTLVMKIENGEIHGLSRRQDIFHDDVHMNSLGNYFMANLVFSAIYNRSPEGLTHTMLSQGGSSALSVDPTLAAQLQQLAWQVISDYRTAQTLPEAQNSAPNSIIVTPNGFHVDVGRELTFVASATDADLDTNFTYQWDFGSFAPSQNTQTSTPIVFNQAGTYKVFLTATDSLGKSDPSPAKTTVVVSDPQNPNHAPNGTITSPTTTQTISVGDSLLFTGTATDQDNDPNLNYKWHFGNGAALQFTANTEAVVFNHAGEFDVTFNVTDSLGMVDDTPASVHVSVVEGPIGAEVINNFTATEVTEQGTASLSWSAVSAPVTSYNIIVNNTVVGSATSDATSFELTGLDTAIVNQVSIKGVNISGDVLAESNLYNIAALGDTSGGNGEIAVINLTTEVRLDSWGVALNWTPIAGAFQYYQIFRDGVFVNFTTPSSLSFNNDWLSLNTDYSFQIKAVDASNTVVGESNIVVTKAGDSVAPSKVVNLQAAFNGAYGFNLSWDAATDNAGVQMYLVYRNGQPFSNTTATSFSDDWPPAGVVTYQIFAQDGVQNLGAGSDLITTAIPSQTFNLSGTANPESWGVVLSWNNMGNDVQFYQIYRDGVFAGFTNSNTTSYNDNWLQLKTDYRWQIRAVNAAGELLEVSNEIIMQAGDSIAPTQVANLTVEFNGAYGFNLNWDASTDNSGVAYYKVYRNGEPYTVVYTNSMSDDWPPAGDVSYQIFAVDNYHNIAEGSEVVIANVNP